MYKAECLISSHEKCLDKKIGIEHYEYIKKLSETLPTIEDINKQNDYINNLLQSFRDDNDQFHKDFLKQNEIIRRYDEVLNEKANKQRLLEFQVEMKKSNDFHINET